MPTPRSRFARLAVPSVPWLLVGLAVLFNLAMYWPEWSVAAPDINDHILHTTLISRVNEVWEAGGNPRDPWIPYWGQGFPLLRYYQHLPHLLVVFLFRLLHGAVEPYPLFKGFHLLLLVMPPVAFYFGARLLGFGRLAAAWSGVCASLLAVGGERYFMGFQPTTFTTIGPGLFPQSVAVSAFPLTLGVLHRTLIRGRRYFPALLALSFLWLSHLVLGYIACLLGIVALLRPELSGRRVTGAARLAALYAGTFGVCAYLVLPALVESPLLNRSIWESAVYWDSFGMSRVLKELFSGNLLDGPRLPVLTILGFLGLALLFFSRSISKIAAVGAVRFAGIAFGVSLLLYFGRPTWGAALKLLPFSDFLPWHRWLCALQYTALLLAGLAIAWIWRKLEWDRSPQRLAIASLVAVVALAPAFVSQWKSAAYTASMRVRSAADYVSGQQALNDMLLEVHERDLARPGRAYAGTSWDWGREYKLAEVPVYLYWATHDVSAISYMVHSSGRNSELEVEFDHKRKDHYDLFNVRYLFHYDRSQQPLFSELFGQRSGVHAATVDTPGYFDVVGADLFYSGSNTPEELLRFNRRFIKGSLHANRRFVRMGIGPRDQPAAGERLVKHSIDLAALEGRGWRPPGGSVLEDWGSKDCFGARVRAEDDSYVLFRMTYHPNWRVRVDERSVEPVMLAPSYIGIPVSPGDHRIEAFYDSRDWTVVVFYVGFVLLGLTLLGDRLGIWPDASDGEAPNRRRILVEVVACLGVLGILTVWVNAPIPAERSGRPAETPPELSSCLDRSE